MDKKAYEKLPDVVGVLEEFYGRLDLSEDDEQALLRHVRNIKGQLYQPSADDQFVGEQLSAIRDMLRTRAGNELADAVAKEIDGMLDPADAAEAKSETSGEAGRGGGGTKATVSATVGVLVGVAGAVFGGWLINDGLLGGFVADRKEMGIGVAALTAGVFVLMTAVRWLVKSALWRAVLGAVVLVAVVAFTASAASRAAGRDETINLGADAKLVTIVESGRQAAVPSEALRPAWWYESGIEVRIEQDHHETTLTIPEKYVVTAR
ncbi:MAG: hypothetical protein ACLFVW_04355 [Phycisphaerae bacterium]